MSAKTLDSSYDLLRSWTSGTKIITGKTKCSRDPSLIRLSITEARCYRTRMYLKAYLIGINSA